MTIKGNMWTRWTFTSVFCPHGLFVFFSLQPVNRRWSGLREHSHCLSLFQSMQVTKVSEKLNVSAERSRSLRPWAESQKSKKTWTCFLKEIFLSAWLKSISLLNASKIKKQKKSTTCNNLHLQHRVEQSQIRSIHSKRNVANVFNGAHGGIKNHPGDCLFLFHCLVLDVWWRTFRSCCKRTFLRHIFKR